MLIALPLAFVEPDEKQMNKKPLLTRLSIFAAGPFANICTGAIVLLISAFFVAPALASVTETDGIAVTGVVEEGWLCEKYNIFCPEISEFPAKQAGLQKGDIITSVNGVETLTTVEFEKELSDLKPKDTVILGTQRRDFQITTTTDPKNESRGYIGISLKQSMKLKEDIKSEYGSLPWGLYYLRQLCYWVFLLNIGVGLINLLPLSLIHI